MKTEKWDIEFDDDDDDDIKGGHTHTHTLANEVEEDGVTGGGVARVRIPGGRVGPSGQSKQVREGGMVTTCITHRLLLITPYCRGSDHHTTHHHHHHHNNTVITFTLALTWGGGSLQGDGTDRQVYLKV